MKYGKNQSTPIGVFTWMGIHMKWVCESSSLGPGLSVYLDHNVIDSGQIEKVKEIFSARHVYNRIAMEFAKEELSSQCVDPESMVLSAIGLGDKMYPNGFVMVYDYPEDVWPDGQLSVVFRNGEPDYFHSDD